jgi:ribosomal protein S18 acetylase RimI-like enzyme
MKVQTKMTTGTMGHVILRPGRPEDVDGAVDAWRVSNTARRGGRPIPPEHEARVRGYAHKPDAFLVVADDGGSIVGMALAMQGLADDGAGPPIPRLCHISMVFVLPARWGQGIGGELVKAILAEAGKRGYDRAQLWTHADNLRAQRLYEGLGFVRTGREVDDDTGERIVQFGRAVEVGRS